MSRAGTPSASATPVNVAWHLQTMAADHPDHLAVVCANRALSPSAYPRYTFADLNRSCDRLAHALTAAGIERGMRVALMVPPSLDFFALTFAMFKVGAVPVFIDPGIGIKNLGKCLAESKPTAFVGIAKAQIARRLLGWARKTVRLPITVGRSIWPFVGGSRLDRWLDAAPETPFDCVDSEPEESAAILFTSGSTGVPKGAVYPHRVFATQVELIRQQYGIEPGEIDLPTFPLFALFDPALGMAAVIPDMDFTRPARVDPSHLVTLIESFGVTSMFGSPAVVRRLADHVTNEKIELPSLRRFLSAGAPASPPSLEKLSRALAPGVQVHTPYGATECLPVSTIGSQEVLSEADATGRGAGVCVGRAFSRAAIEIIEITEDPITDWSEARRLPTGEVGEITVTGPMATREYFGRPQATAAAKIAGDPNAPQELDGTERTAEFGSSPARQRMGDASHRMGDLGYFDESGRLWFCGRKSHRIETGSVRYLTIPCEGVFNVHPDVFRTALVPVTRDGKKRPVLCVQLEPESSAHRNPKERQRVKKELLELGRQHDHTRPIVEFLFHPSFPVDIRHNSKIFREQLAEWAQKRVAK